MKIFLALASAIAILFGAIASAQVDPSRQTTEQEMKQLRELADDHAEAMFAPYKVNWDDVLIYRVDLDGDGHKEAMVIFQGIFYCGAAACDILVVKWTAGQAVVVSIINDSGVEVLKKQTLGWHDLHAHYYDYKWNGRRYERICRPSGVCEDG